MSTLLNPSNPNTCPGVFTSNLVTMICSNTLIAAAITTSIRMNNTFPSISIFFYLSPVLPKPERLLLERDSTSTSSMPDVNSHLSFCHTVAFCDSCILNWHILVFADIDVLLNVVTGNIHWSSLPQ